MTPREAFELFLTPPRFPVLSNESKLLAQATDARRVRLGPNGFARGGGEEVQMYVWGNAGPTVLFVHGWGGNAGNHAAGIKAVVQAGGRAVAFDAPAHGQSEGTFCSAPGFAWALQGVAREIVGDGELQGIIGHSLGGGAVCIALGAGWLRTRAAVLMASSCWVRPVLKDFTDRQGYAPEFAEAVQEVAAREFTSDEYSAEPNAARQGGVRALLLHDPEDREIGYEHSAAIARAWPGAELEAVPKVGHRSILRSQGVVAAMCRHLGLLKE